MAALADAGDPPAAPRAATPAELGFAPQPRVRWFAPTVLVTTGVRVLVATTLGQFLDRRETQATAPAEVVDLRDEPGALWIDYVSDAADGFDAAATVASVVARDELTLRDTDGREHHTSAGSLLVLGGDQAYPSASVRTYQDRMCGPYRAMLPWSARPRRVVAVPGNHDWYDGLGSFLRTFCQRRWMGAWRTEQRRSYFAVRLPGGWHLWGLDVALDTDLDTAQLEYFRARATEIGPDDAVVLCWAKPGWVETGPSHPEAYALMEFVERTVLRDRSSLRLSLSGDSHHYARFAGPDGEQKITAGGGGAYLSATHHLPDRVQLPSPHSRDPRKGPPVTFERRCEYPSVEQSRRLVGGVVRSVHRNGLFWTIPAVLYGVLALLLTRAFPGLVEPGPMGLQVPETAAAAVFVGLLACGLVRFTQRAGPSAVALGIAHAAAHLAVVVCTVALTALVEPPSWGVAVVLGAAVVVGGLLGPLVLAGYLVLADRVGEHGTNVNEVFAAQGLESHKGFVRLRVAADGTLTVYPIKVERVSRWRFAPGAAPGARWFEPDVEPVPELIENPIVVSRRPGQPGETSPVS